jgi:hypothetical protein
MSRIAIQNETPVTTAESALGHLQQLESQLQALRTAGAATPVVTTSSRTGEWRAVAVVAVVLGIVECAFLVGRHKLSKDVEHLQAFEALAAKLARAPYGQPKLLFLGNSLTRYGVDEAVFSETLTELTGQPPATVKVVPDNTAVADWSYVFRNQFARPDRAPDMLVIGFEAGHLRDAPSRHPDRLAQYYCTWSDWPELCRRDLPNFESRAAFVLEKSSAMVGNRDRVTRRALDMLIPGYREGMDRINASLMPHGSATIAPTYDRLGNLIELAQQQKVEVVLAAMPVPERYEFDAELLGLVQKKRVKLIDLRTVDGIEPTMFFDGLHMDAAGGKIYSRALAQQLAGLISHP